MTYREAAVAVLREARRPLTAAEIVERALAKGLIRDPRSHSRRILASALYTAPPDVPIRRVFRQGPTRAARGWSAGCTTVGHTSASELSHGAYTTVRFCTPMGGNERCAISPPTTRLRRVLRELCSEHR